jgi:hypothetical protein
VCIFETSLLRHWPDRETRALREGHAGQSAGPLQILHCLILPAEQWPLPAVQAITWVWCEVFIVLGVGAKEQTAEHSCFVSKRTQPTF